MCQRWAKYDPAASEPTCVVLRALCAVRAILAAAASLDVHERAHLHSGGRVESSVESSLGAASVSSACEIQWLQRKSYRLESELHERRVVDLSNLILGPVISWCRCIHSVFQDSSLSCLGRRRGRSRSNRRECVIHHSAELASPWRRAGCRA